MAPHPADLLAPLILARLDDALAQAEHAIVEWRAGREGRAIRHLVAGWSFLALARSISRSTREGIRP